MRGKMYFHEMSVKNVGNNIYCYLSLIDRGHFLNEVKYYVKLKDSWYK